MRYSTPTIVSLLLLSLLSIPGCNMPLNTTNATAVLSAGNEVPPTKSTATGEADVKVDVKADKLSWTITYTGLSGAVTGAHFHGPAALGTNADVAVKIEGDMLSPIKGETTITNEQKTQLLDGKWYVNLHTAANPDGEIRGQLTVKQ